MSDDDRGNAGYVHRPGNSAGSATSAAADPATASPDGDTDGFGARGWVLVGSLVVSVLIVPGVIYLYPTAPGDAGLSFVAAMLALPMVPAVLLGLTAVWSMTAASHDERPPDE